MEKISAKKILEVFAGLPWKTINLSKNNEFQNNNFPSIKLRNYVLWFEMKWSKIFKKTIIIKMKVDDKFYSYEK